MDYIAPAYQFEQQTGLKGLSCRYIMPGGIPAWYLEAEMKHQAHIQPDVICFIVEGSKSDGPADKFQRALLGPEAKARALAIYAPTAKEIIDLNPNLQVVSLNPDYVGDAYHLILGATSMFNVQDIQYFISRNHGLCIETEHARTMRQNQINWNIGSTLGHNAQMQWIASDATLDLIEKQWDEKYPQISLSGKAFAPPAGP